jgi:hypothetical protein
MSRPPILLPERHREFGEQRELLAALDVRVRERLRQLDEARDATALES